MEENDDGAPSRREDSRSVENVGVAVQKDVKNPVLMRLDEIGENYENLKTKVISYLSNKAEQSRVGRANTSSPMDVDNVSGCEKNVEDWKDVDEIRRSMRCHTTVD